ncbi:TIGR03745 family integrating conjugative element membrane protein [Thioalkalivibrio sp. ALE28]|uniref:TIGR03745 family integrating conjugative element membrane protein n=1 Tax=Thioalkalivibrio sp. ALE28 TaxID=1158179 RepID=UPI00036E4175|nr:TIGR03745 family integrating conjugative element membrane protein [Thioalkalivibrio sp. ALE28]
MLKTCKRHLARAHHLFLAGLVIAIHSTPAWAQNLPTAPEPDGGFEDGNWIDLMRGYLYEGATLLGTLIAVASFLWVSWTALTKFNEARQGKAEWGEVGLLGVVGAVILLVLSFFVTQAMSIME